MPIFDSLLHESDRLIPAAGMTAFGARLSFEPRQVGSPHPSGRVQAWVSELFPLPKGRGAANPKTPSFDRQGVLWFTGQNRIYGRLDPKTGG